MEEGYFKGETCNREECKGIIQEHDSYGGCSCHINPPCSYCETPREYCPECDWDAEDERRESMEANKPTQEQLDRWKEEREKGEAIRNEFDRKFRSNENVSVFDYRSESHSNSSMKITGMFPVGTEIDMNKIRGTFGGRFEMINKEKGRFIYIAYTD
ncbi:hypothetical protein [uncultured Clostridium sp.]|uniref:hypothetical protein n=1 Tax=uncultured Clostridium sp. TaxID=59620 RepID=UPI00262346D9|nr:hypothetical protein [uncultured Clostridium sp.]